jgi:hypothetical protein
MEVNASKISDVTNISFLVKENSTPLVASFNLFGALFKNNLLSILTLLVYSE